MLVLGNIWNILKIGCLKIEYIRDENYIINRSQNTVIGNRINNFLFKTKGSFILLSDFLYFCD